MNFELNPLLNPALWLLLGVALFIAGRWLYALLNPCKWYGHQPPFGYGDSPGEGYLRIRYEGTDGLRVVHAGLYGECERCGVMHRVGKVHVPKTDQSI